MAITEKKGNLFSSSCEYIVNTINCDGYMGKGIALEASIRYPDMEKRYQELCKEGSIDIGKLWIYDSHDGSQKVLNFPTKYHFRNPSKPEYLEEGLKKFVDTYRQRDIRSIAFPLLGANNGGLSQESVLDIMRSYLDTLTDINIDIYFYDKSEYVIDSFFESFIRYLCENRAKKGYSKLLDGIDQYELKSFSEIVSTKRQVETSSGKSQRRSLATKKFLQNIVDEMRNGISQTALAI